MALSPRIKPPKATVGSLLRSLAGRSQPARSTSKIHASDLTKETEFCPREWYLLNKHNVSKRDEDIPATLAMTFDTGNAIQDLVTNKWLVSRAVGDWECLSCGKTKEFCSKPAYGPLCYPSRCQWRTREVVLRHKDYPSIVGSIDLIVDFGPDRKLHMVECKIIDKDYFADLAAPMAEHTARTMFYLWLASECEDPVLRERLDTETATVLYISRSYGKKVDGRITPVKEYEVSRNDAVALHYFDKAVRAIEGIRSDSIPDRVCKSQHDKRGAACAVCKQCWENSED